MPAILIFDERNTFALQRSRENDSWFFFCLLGIVKRAEQLADVVSIDDQRVPSERRPALLVDIHVMLKHRGLALAEAIHINDGAEVVYFVVDSNFSCFPN